jgi:hypothetical protein
MAAVALAALAGGGAYFALSSRGVRLDGKWTADVEQQQGLRHRYRVHLNLINVEGTLSGVVDYPSGTGAIREGTVSGRRLSFHTVHLPQFASTEATIRVDGTIRGEEIDLTFVSESGIAKGVARKAE